MGKAKFCRALVLASVSFAALSGTNAFAAEADQPEAAEQNSYGIADIVVTARRREESLQQTPLAITAVTAETLEARNIVDLENIARITPNFTLYETSGGLGSAVLYMRGIGYADSIPGQDSPIAIYSDGVLMGRNGTATMDIVEPERIEVLRGPQGTLFGRNTTGGAILVTTHEPDDEANGMYKVSYGRFNDRRMQGRIDTGLLGDTGVKLSVAGSIRRNDGTFDDIDRPDRLDPGAERSSSLWAKLRGEWGDVKLMIVGDYSKLSGTPAPLQVVAATPNVAAYVANSPGRGGGAYTITQTPQYRLQDAYGGVQRAKAMGVNMTWEWAISDAVTFKSISAYRAFKRNDPAAYGPGNLRGLLRTGTTPNFTFSPVAWEGLYQIPRRQQDQNQISQELQLLGSVGDFDYVLGAYYYKEDANEASLARLPNIVSATAATQVLINRAYSGDTKSLAGFAQANWRPAFADGKLELTGGIRYTDDKKVFFQIIPVGPTRVFKSDNFSYLISANYKITPDAMIYARYSTGYRAGGYSARAFTAGGDPVFEPETIKSAEGGFKLDLLGRRLRLNGAVFYNDYSNLQVGAFVPPAGGSAGGNIAENADATYKGFEIEAELVPVEGLSLRGSLGYVDPKYKSYPTALLAGGVVDSACAPLRNAANLLVAMDCADATRFTYFPKMNVDLSGTFSTPIGDEAKLAVTLAWSYKSRIEFKDRDTVSAPTFRDEVRQKGYGLLSGRVAVSDIPLGGVRGQFAVFGDNLTNQTYTLQGIDFASYATRYFGNRRTIGAELKILF